MSATVIPDQPKRWGNESTNFYQASFTAKPGVATRDKVYRCDGSQYTHSGHYHLGTKAINLYPPVDTYRPPSSRRPRSADQGLSRNVCNSETTLKPLSPEQPVNLYQSHQQKYHLYAMTPPPPVRSSAESPFGREGLSRSLNQSFYTTSYQSDIARYAGHRSRSKSESGPVGTGGSTSSLCTNLETRRNSITSLSQTRPGFPLRRNRVTSAPPTRPPQAPAPLHMSLPSKPVQLQRRRSFSALQQSLPTRSEMLKDIFTVYPAPEPKAVSKRQARPSSAVSLRAGKIPNLRAKNAWV